MKLLYINSSPRGQSSASNLAADIVLNALPQDCEVEQIDLFDIPLPEVTLEITAAKMKQFLAIPLEDEEARQWKEVIRLVEQFLSADAYVFGVPMWNFHIPYKLKHYIDVINHPGLTFTSDANGPRGLASGSALLIYARGGNYSPKEGQPDPLDFQSTYMKAWLGSVGITEVTEVLVQNTLAGPDAGSKAVAGAEMELRAFAKGLASGV